MGKIKDTINKLTGKQQIADLIRENKELLKERNELIEQNILLLGNNNLLKESVELYKKTSNKEKIKEVIDDLDTNNPVEARIYLELKEILAKL